MAFYVIEPSLRDRGGHHFEFATTLATAASSTHDEVCIFAHKDCIPGNTHGAKIIPWFSNHIHEDIKAVPYQLSNFLYFNASIYRDLKRLQKTFRIQRTDAVLFPTLSENQLAGIIRWIEEFETNDAPLFIIYLMFSPDFWQATTKGNENGPVNERALFYWLALRNAAQSRKRLRIFAGGRQIAREFSGLTKSDIAPHPLPMSLSPARRRDTSARQRVVLLHAGTAKEDKGLLFLADLADRLSVENPEDRFLIHIDFRSTPNTPEEAIAGYNKLILISARRQNIVLRVGVLDRDEYLAFIEQAGCFICTYDPVTYARKTSGIVWEAISLGLPILGPDNTFIQREAAEWGASFAGYSCWSAVGIAEAYRSFRQVVEDLAYASQEASNNFRSANDHAALVNHLASCADRVGKLRKSRPAIGLKNTPVFLTLAWFGFRVSQIMRALIPS